jgi:phosphopantothenoylcysteine decarboxylase/phosphopantothenate--cysteine ligase
MLRDKKIVLAVTGGIAAYKSAELLRLFIREDARVRVVMTAHAQEFITPLTFQTLSGEPVVTDMFNLWQDSRIGHIALAEWADCLVVAPATANILGKIAAGIADDMLSTVILAFTAPVIVCPAMDVNMYKNRVVQANLNRLRKSGVYVVEPGIGLLASGAKGKGRLAELEDILEDIEVALAKKDFAGKRVMVTAGPTRESIDPVRYISNRSSGKMGYALARVARRRGAEVVLIAGPTSLPDPPGIRMIRVNSASQMYKACMSEAKKADIIIKASAVSDYRPRQTASQKIKKKQSKFFLELEENPDIIAEIGRRKGSRILVGFAAETSDVLKHAKEKMQKKNLDLMVANDVTRPGAGFDHDTNIVMVIDRFGEKGGKGEKEEWQKMSKIEVAEKLFDRIGRMKAKRAAKKTRNKASP